MPVVVKRVYRKAVPSDGTRVLVDRLWPRGLEKAAAEIDAWLRNLAPSDELRRWLHAEPGAWTAFRKRYLKELSRAEAAPDLEKLYKLAGKRKKLTLLFASKDEEHNNAVVLRDLLEGMRKPPTGTGPGMVSGGRARQVRRMPRP